MSDGAGGQERDACCVLREGWARATHHAPRLPHDQRRNRQRQQRQAKRVHLRVVAVMQQVEHAQRQRLAPGRHDQDHGLHVPEAEQEDHIPRGGGLRRDLRPLHIAQHLPARRALQARDVSQIAVHRLQGVGDGVPAQRQVPDHKGQNDNRCALIEERKPGPIEQHDQPDAEQYPGDEEGEPGEPAEESRKPKAENRRKAEDRNRESRRTANRANTITTVAASCGQVERIPNRALAGGQRPRQLASRSA